MVLSLFPGADLLGSAFEEAGFCVVRGPDLLHGGDVRDFHVPAGYFHGVIGGPPCQSFSSGTPIGKHRNKVHAMGDQIPEFLRVVEEASPDWVVMENVPRASKHPEIPEKWHKILLRDWDCGGLTSRKRMVWTYPFELQGPRRREGQPSRSVMASTHLRGSTEANERWGMGFLPADLPIEQYAELQGAGVIGKRLLDAWWFLSERARRALLIHYVGNGVPLAMGQLIAQQVVDAVGDLE